jgi:hypothetical protein
MGIMPRERQIVLLDVENLVGDGRVSDSSIEQLSRALGSLIRIDRNDIVLIGGDQRNAFGLDYLAKRYGGQVVWGAGPDGADRALSRAFSIVPASAWDCPYAPITRVVIGSGDHYFVPTACAARSMGRQVLTISRWFGLSSELATSVDQCLTLPIV